MNSILFIPHHVPLKSQTNQGSFVRITSLVSFIKSNPKNSILIPSRLCFDYISGLLIILATIRFNKNKIVLFSYPNLPFFGTNAINFFFFNVFIKTVKHLCVKLNKKIILDVDDVPSISENFLRQWPLSNKHLQRLKTIEKRLFEAADIIWVITKNQAKVMSQLYAIDENKFVAAPNGNIRLTTTPKLPNSDKIRFVFAGAFFLAGIKEMLDSFVRLQSNQVELYLLGPYSKWLKAHLSKLNDPRIKFLGSLNYKSCEEIVKSCQVGLLCYDPNEKYYDIAHPVKLSLYITCGLPVISTNVKGYNDLIKQQEIGLISDFPNMTASMKELTENNELRKKLTENCAKIKENFYYDTIYKKALVESSQKLKINIGR